MITQLDKYIAKRVAVPLAAIICIAALLLVLERMLRLFDFVVSEGGPATVVAQMLANLVPQYLGLALPVGVFLGSLIAFRDLAQKSELDILRASGLSLWRMALPTAFIAVLITCISSALVGWIQPYTRYLYQELAYDLRSGAFGAAVRPGEFVKIADNTILKINSTSADGSTMRQVFLERRQNNSSGSNERIATITAAEGQLLRANSADQVILRLYDGQIVQEFPAGTNKTPTQPKILRFSQQDIAIRLPAAETFRTRGGQHREMTLPELYKAFSYDQTNPNLWQFKAAFHWRLANILSILWLPFLAIPFALTAKRQGGNRGLVVGLAILIVYNELMESMQRLAVKTGAPYTSIWILYAAVMLFAFWLFARSNKSADSDPLASIQNMIVSPLRRAKRS